MNVRAIIAGGRDFDDYSKLEALCLESFLKLRVVYDFDQEDICIVSGFAKGADSLGERFAEEYELKVARFKADWDGLGKAAGPIRNKKMSEFASVGDLGALIAFWDGKSRGTKNMIDTAIKDGLKVFVHKY